MDITKFDKNFAAATVKKYCVGRKEPAFYI